MPKKQGYEAYALDSASWALLISESVLADTAVEVSLYTDRVAVAPLPDDVADELRSLETTLLMCVVRGMSSELAWQKTSVVVWQQIRRWWLVKAALERHGAEISLFDVDRLLIDLDASDADADANTPLPPSPLQGRIAPVSRDDIVDQLSELLGDDTDLTSTAAQAAPPPLRRAASAPNVGGGLPEHLLTLNGNFVNQAWAITAPTRVMHPRYALVWHSEDPPLPLMAIDRRGIFSAVLPPDWVWPHGRPDDHHEVWVLAAMEALDRWRRVRRPAPSPSSSPQAAPVAASRRRQLRAAEDITTDDDVGRVPQRARVDPRPGGRGEFYPPPMRRLTLWEDAGLPSLRLVMQNGRAWFQVLVDDSWTSDATAVAAAQDQWNEASQRVSDTRRKLLSFWNGNGLELLPSAVVDHIADMSVRRRPFPGQQTWSNPNLPTVRRFADGRWAVADGDENWTFDADAIRAAQDRWNDEGIRISSSSGTFDANSIHPASMTEAGKRKRRDDDDDNDEKDEEDEKLDDRGFPVPRVDPDDSEAVYLYGRNHGRWMGYSYKDNRGRLHNVDDMPADVLQDERGVNRLEQYSYHGTPYRADPSEPVTVRRDADGNVLDVEYGGHSTLPYIGIRSSGKEGKQYRLRRNKYNWGDDQHTDSLVQHSLDAHNNYVNRFNEERGTLVDTLLHGQISRDAVNLITSYADTLPFPDRWRETHPEPPRPQQDDEEKTTATEAGGKRKRRDDDDDEKKEDDNPYERPTITFTPANPDHFLDANFTEARDSKGRLHHPDGVAKRRSNPYLGQEDEFYIHGERGTLDPSDPTSVHLQAAGQTSFTRFERRDMPYIARVHGGHEDVPDSFQLGRNNWNLLPGDDPQVRDASAPYNRLARQYNSSRAPTINRELRRVLGDPDTPAVVMDYLDAVPLPDAEDPAIAPMHRQLNRDLGRDVTDLIGDYLNGPDLMQTDTEARVVEISDDDHVQMTLDALDKLPASVTQVHGCFQRIVYTQQQRRREQLEDNQTDDDQPSSGSDQDDSDAS